MLVKLFMYSKKQGHKTVTKRMSSKQFQRLQNKLGIVENDVELYRIEILEN